MGNEIPQFFVPAATPDMGKACTRILLECAIALFRNAKIESIQ
jgi:hypothetical protein